MVLGHSCVTLTRVTNLHTFGPLPPLIKVDPNQGQYYWTSH